MRFDVAAVLKFKSRDLKDRINTTFFEEFFAIWKIFDRFVFKTSLLEAISNSGHSFQQDRMRLFSLQFRENIWTQRKKKKQKIQLLCIRSMDFFFFKRPKREFFRPFLWWFIHSCGNFLWKCSFYKRLLIVKLRLPLKQFRKPSTIAASSRKMRSFQFENSKTVYLWKFISKAAPFPSPPFKGFLLEETFSIDFQ